MLGAKLKHAIGIQQAYKNDALTHLRQIILSLLCAAMALGAQSAWAIAGKIENIIGTARIAKQTGQIYAAIKGDNLYEGDSVATAANSNVQIRMVDEAIVWVPAPEHRIQNYQVPIHRAR